MRWKKKERRRLTTFRAVIKWPNSPMAAFCPGRARTTPKPSSAPGEEVNQPADEHAQVGHHGPHSARAAHRSCPEHRPPLTQRWAEHLAGQVQHHGAHNKQRK